MSRTSSVGKVDDSDSRGTQFESRNKLSACVVGQGTLPKVVLDNDDLLSLDYEIGMLKNLMAALESEYIIYTK